MKKSVGVFLLLVVLFSLSLFFIFGVGDTSSKGIQINEYTLNCYVTTINLPLVAYNYSNIYTEIEPNSPNLLATGPLINGRVYTGKINDLKDYYSVYIDHNTQLSVALWNMDGDDKDLRSVHRIQLQLFHTGLQQIPVSATHRITTVRDPDYKINHSAQPGWYFVYIYAPRKNTYNTRYGLKVAYPTLVPNTPFPALPKCTPTITPSPTFTITPSATPTTLCPFEAPSSGFSVRFPEGVIVANGVMTDAISTAVPSTPISPGIYQVTMYSYDDHATKVGQDQKQEIWYLRLRNAAGEIIATAGPSLDIPDDVDHNCQATYLEDTLILVDTAVFAEAIHAAYPRPTNQPHSVNPDYALLIPVRMVAATPSRTPTPPHYATQTPTP